MLIYNNRVRRGFWKAECYSSVDLLNTPRRMRVEFKYSLSYI